MSVTNLVHCWPDEWWADTLGNERRYWSDIDRMFDFLELDWTKRVLDREAE